MCEDEDVSTPEVENCSKPSAVFRTFIGGYSSSIKRSPFSSKYPSSPRYSSTSSSTENYSSPSSPIKRSEEESQSPCLNPKSTHTIAKKLPEEALAFGDMKKRTKLQENPVKLTKISPLSAHSGSSALAPWSPLSKISGTPSSPPLVSSPEVPLSPFQKKNFQVRKHTFCSVPNSLQLFFRQETPLQCGALPTAQWQMLVLETHHALPLLPLLGRKANDDE